MSLANQENCVAALRQIAEQTKTQQLKQDGYFYVDSGLGKGYVDVAFARNIEVDSLQGRAVGTFNDLHAGMRESDKAKMTDATGLKLEIFRSMVIHQLEDCFDPHHPYQIPC